MLGRMTTIFQFRVVRLKEPTSLSIMNGIENFNSTMVRLKVTMRFV